MIPETEIVTRLLIAAGVGSVIGFERGRLIWSAGIRTHMLVAVGACLAMIVSAYGFQNATQMPHVVLDPSRIAAQVISGVGFLGAGSILLRGNTVRGMTTAASIWAVAGLGLAAGGGLYFVTAAATIVILLILAGLKPIEEAYRARVQSCVMHVQVERDALSIDDIKRVLRGRGGQIRRLTRTVADDGSEQQTIHLVRVSRSDIDSGTKRLHHHPGVLSVSVRRRQQPVQAE